VKHESQPQGDPPPFESGIWPIEVIAVWKNDGTWSIPWAIATVMFRDKLGQIHRHPRWSAPFFAEDPDETLKEWAYLAERIRDGVGGNIYSYHPIGFEVDEPNRIDGYVEAMTWETVKDAPVLLTRIAPIETSTGEPATDETWNESLGYDDVGGTDDLHHVEEPNRFLVERVPLPRWVNDSDDNDRARAAFGTDLPWSFAVPWVHRALVSPFTREPILQEPQPGDVFSSGALAYWSSLLHLLVYSFGWTRPDRGLRWWYDAGKPVDDPRFQLIAQIWDADGQLDLFAAWLWTTPHMGTEQLVAITGFQSENQPVGVDRQWLQEVQRRADALNVPSPCIGGWDPLHLNYHLDGPLSQIPGKPKLLRSPRQDRHATLLVDSMSGWYRALIEQGVTLPNIGARSWHVDVVVRPVGWMGTFRQSRITGIWFAGRHCHHVIGN
jgi:hypothetical protein